MSRRLWFLLCALAALGLSQCQPAPAPPRHWYVSPTGNNLNGQSWATAWAELDQINWEQIAPGDVVWLDGGSPPTGIIYRTPLVVGASGTAVSPIRLALSTEHGRDYQATLFGGRDTPLPHCQQTNYTPPDPPTLSTGINFNDQQYVSLDGQKWGGIRLHGYRHGLTFTPATRHISLRYLEIFDNGWAEEETNGWVPNGRGITLAGANHRFERLILRDNGQDAIQSLVGDNQISQLTIHESWLHNSRRHPTQPDESFNNCTHSDGLQIYAGGQINHISISETVFGPGLTQSVVLGQAPYNDRGPTQVDDVLFRDVLFLPAAGINVYGYRDIPSQNWTFDHVTLDCAPGTTYTGLCLNLEGGGHTLTNSLIMGSKNQFTSDPLYNPWGTLAQNCQYDNSQPATGSQVVLGDELRPLFMSTPPRDPFYLGDYTQREESPCHGRGSRLTAISALLNR